MFELRKFTVLLFVFSIPALLFAVPQWVSDPYCEFPQSDYICGIGSGSTLTDADNAAKTEIAGFFGTSVDSQIRSFSSYGSASDSEEIFETDSVSAIVVDDISGIRIDSRHFSNDMFYSHAVLKKSSAAMYCAEKIPALEKQLLQIQTLIKDTQGSFSAMQDCERYTKIYDKYLKNIRMVNVLNDAAVLKPNSLISDPDLLRLFTLKASEVTVTVNGDDNGQIRSAVERVFTDIGYSISRGQARNAVTVDVSIEDFEMGKNPNKFVLYSISVNVTDIVQNRQLFGFNKQGREGQRTAEGARVKAYYYIQNIIRGEFADSLRNSSATWN